MQTMQKLKAVGVKPSITRIMIYDYIFSTKDHPNVDEIFITLKETLPTLSKTTVYNTVHLLKTHRLIKAYAMPNHEMRYDANLDVHAHFLCASCGQITDVLIDVCDIVQTVISENCIDETVITFHGTCSKCQTSV